MRQSRYSYGVIGVGTVVDTTGGVNTTILEKALEAFGCPKRLPQRVKPVDRKEDQLGDQRDSDEWLTFANNFRSVPYGPEEEMSESLCQNWGASDGEQ